jgi:hypothetical protein
MSISGDYGHVAGGNSSGEVPQARDGGAVAHPSNSTTRSVCWRPRRIFCPALSANGDDRYRKVSALYVPTKQMQGGPTKGKGFYSQGKRILG